MRTAFRDMLTELLTLACNALQIERPVLNDMSDFQKLLYRVGQIYGMPDTVHGNRASQDNEVFHSLRLALEQLVR